MSRKQLPVPSISKKAQFILGLVERYWWFFVIIAFIATYALIMILAAGQNIWFDEGYSITLSKHSVGDLLALTAVDAHPPFYYLLLKFWAGIFEWSEFALRSLSAIAASLTVGVAVLFIRRLFTVRVALATIPFLVLSPFFLRYGYEVRMYALVGLICLIATWVLVKAVESKRNTWWILYAVLVALGMYTLYMSVVVWLAHLVWLLVRTLKSRQPIHKQKWILAYIVSVILFLPYMSIFIHQTTNSALPGIGSALTINVLSGVTSMLISFVPGWQVGGLLSIFILITIGLSIYLVSFIWRKSRGLQRSYLQLLLFCLLVPIAFYMIISLSPKPFFIDRYVAHISIFFYMIIAIIVALGWRYGRRLIATMLGALVIILLSIGVAQLGKTGNFNFERMQYPMTTELRQTIVCNQNTVIVADDPYTYIDINYYFDGCDLRFYSKNNVDFNGGYALLHDSKYRVDDLQTLNATTLYHVHWGGHDASFQPDSRYHLVRSSTFGKQVIDCYSIN